MKNKKIIFVSIVIVLVFVCILILLNIKPSSNNQIDKTEDNNIQNDNNTNLDNNDVVLDLEEKDFSDYDKFSINLSEVEKIVKITKKGVYTLTGSLDGYINIDSEDNIKIILDNANIKNDNGPSILIASAKNTYIELVGESKLEDSKNYEGYDEDVNGTIYSKDDLFITGNGVLNLVANHGDGIVSKDDLTIFSGTINIESKDDGIRGKDTVKVKDGIININSDGDGIKTTNTEDTEKGYIYIENGEFNIISNFDGIQAENNIIIKNGKFNITTGGGSYIMSSNNDRWGYWNSSTTTESAKAIKAVNDITIEEGEFNISSSDDAVHSNGNINIKNGEFNISSGDDGMHADSTLTIDNGNITISKSYEGLEANEITINNGNINVTASDDGINVAGGNDGSAFGRPGENPFEASQTNILIINDGNIYINASGDGLDSNGSIVMNLGTVIVDGPTNDGNGALDYGSSFTINGGTLIAAGSSGMAQNISNSSSQAGVLINFDTNQKAETLVNINNVITYSPSKQFSSILISTPNLKQYETFTISLEGTSTGTENNGLYIDGQYSGGTTYDTFTVNGIVNSVGRTNSMGGMHGMGPVMPGDRGPR